MKRSPLCATFVAGLTSTLLVAAPTVAQTGVAPARQPAATAATSTAASADAGTRVAVIDIALIFKNHVRFNAMMQEIKTGIEQYEAHMQQKQKEFKAATEALATFEKTSIEYKRKEEELARMQSQLQVDVGLKRKEFLEREARVYFEVYQEIEKAVAVFAQRWRIGLVLRWNSDEMKPDSRDSVLQGVNRAVVYQGGLDITEQILNELNRGAAGAATPTAPQRPASPQLPPTARPFIPGQAQPR